ncbi:MAG: sigma factor, partial [Coriobacteriia bacterium]|nr:sigma factor [Coriobacteriia bacterium]
MQQGRLAQEALDMAETGQTELGKAELKHLGRAAAAGRAAQDKLVLHNQRLVFRLAWNYHRSYGEAHGVGIADIVNAGVAALVDSAREFDPSKGARFATFAWRRVQGAILRYLDRNGRF